MSARMAEKPPPNCRPTAGLLHRYSPMTAPTPPARRSRVTNGALFVEGDANSAWSRRFRDLVAGHASDLGGMDILSDAQVSLVRRAATLELTCEQIEGRLSHRASTLIWTHTEGLRAICAGCWRLYCGPVLRHPAELIQAANDRSVVTV